MVYSKAFDVSFLKVQGFIPERGLRVNVGGKFVRARGQTVSIKIVSTMFFLVIFF